MSFRNALTVLLGAVLCATGADPAVADTFGNGANTFDIEFVKFGNPDVTTGNIGVLINCSSLHA